MAGRKLPPFDAGFELTSPSKGRVFNGHMNKASKKCVRPPSENASHVARKFYLIVSHRTLYSSCKDPLKNLKAKISSSHSPETLKKDSAAKQIEKSTASSP